MSQLKVRQTLISKKPRENAGLVAVFSVLCVLLFSTFCWKEGSPTYEHFSAISQAVLHQGEYWRLFSALLVHADLRHFLSNALLLAAFAYLLYGYFGLSVFPLACFVLGGIVNYISLWTYQPENVSLVGASGMVYLMAAFWLTMYMLIERRRSLGRRVLHGVGVGLIVLMPTAFNHSISYRTHFLGLCTGLVAALLYFWLHKESIRASEELENLEEPYPEVQDEH